MKATLFLVVSFLATNANAMPSMQVWIPSTDIQSFSTLHLNYNTWAWQGKPTCALLGPTFGVLPFNKVQAEVGFDLMLQSKPQLDARPLYFSGKVATPEDAFFKLQPAIALGIYNVGTWASGSQGTNQNIGYGVIARTLPIVGRISVGYFYGNPIVLVDQNGKAANHGFLFSWDRTISELTDKLWLGVDYQGSRSCMGALSTGITWKFTPDVALMFGFDNWLNQAVTLSGKRTVTVQLSVNIEPFKRN